MKVEFSAFPRAFTGNVAVFVAADKQLLATAQAMDNASGGALARALGAGRFTGAKGQTQTLLGQSGSVAACCCWASARAASSMRAAPRGWAG